MENAKEKAYGDGVESDVYVEFVHLRIAVKLDAIRRQVDWWVKFNTDQRAREGLASDDDTHLIAPPVWPSHGQLNNWSRALSEAVAALSGGDPSAAIHSATQGEE